MTARILIITAGQLCRNPRALKEAEALGRAGHEVTVLHVAHHTASEARDRELIRAAAFRRVVIDELQPGISRLRRRLARWATRKLTALTQWQTPRALGPVARMLREARRLPADLTLVHNEVAHAVGLQLHQEGRHVAADIEDWHSEDLLPEDRRYRPIALLVRQEQALLRDLAFTMTTSAALAAALHARYGGRRPHVLTNSFPLQPEPHPPGVASAAGAPALFWFSQRLGPGRGLEPFVEAWQHTTGASRLVLLGEPLGSYREHLRARVTPARREHIQFLDCVSPMDLPGVIARHDVGLALEDGSIRSRDLTITNKLLQYLNAGLAIAATETAGQREVLARAPEAGVLLPADTTRWTAVLDQFLADHAALGHCQRAARRLAEEHYCWERESARLCEIVEHALKGAKPFVHRITHHAPQ